MVGILLPRAHFMPCFISHHSVVLVLVTHRKTLLVTCDLIE
jgi:hypothetical protein